MEPWKNTLVIFAGVKGNIYQFDGSNLQKLKTIPRITEGNLAQVYPGATAVVGGDLLFGVSGTRVTGCMPGIYSLGQKDITKPVALTLKYVGASGILTSQSLTIGSLFPYHYDQFYSGIYDTGVNDQYQINYLSTGTKIPSGAYWESQVYDISKNGFPQLLEGVELNADTMASNIGCSIFFKIDDASSWSELGEITSANQGNILMGINQRAKTIQIKLGLTCNSDDTPKIHTIKIY